MSFTHSLRASARSFLHSPSFALTAILTLGLGLGLSVAVFTVADALILRKLPVLDQDRLVVLWGEMRDHSLDNVPLGLSDAKDFARRSRALESIAYFEYEGSWPTLFVDGARMVRLRRALVSGNFFGVLGAQPVLGRALGAADDVVGAAPVAVISYRTWRGSFGGDSRIVGRRLIFQETGVAYTIVGVMPSGLEYPSGTELWLPITPISTVKDSTYALVDFVARLTPSATPASGETELTRFFSRARAETSAQVRAVARPLASVILGDARPAVLVFAGAAGLLLLITCMNVANLLLVRGLARAREIAVRAALGASTRQLVIQLLTESGILAVAGGVAGVALAAIAVRGLTAFAPSDIPQLSTVRVDRTVAVAAVVITAVAMLAFGVAPAFATAHTDGQKVFRSGARQSASRRSRMVRELLVGAQVALAVMVLSAAALLGRSLLQLEHADLHIDDSHLLIAELGLRYDRYDDFDKRLALVRTLATNVAATPGVEAVSPVLTVPFSGAGGWDAQATIDGQSTTDAARNPMFNLELVTPDYFQTVGLAVLHGRALLPTDRQGTERVAVISQSMARRYWPNQEPIGKRLRMGPRGDRVVTIVGVVPDTRYRDLREARASVYFPLSQSTFSFTPTTLAIRTTGDPTSMISAIRRAIAVSAPGVVLANAGSFATYEAAPLAQPRLDAFLLSVFAVAAALLAGVGLFAVMTTLVVQRTREIGVRLALGATSQEVQSLVMRSGLRLAGGGVLSGLVGALLTNRLLSSLLFDVTPTDAITLVGVGGLLFMVALAATFVPARAGARIDPAVALRSGA